MLCSRAAAAGTTFVQNGSTITYRKWHSRLEPLTTNYADTHPNESEQSYLSVFGFMVLHAHIFYLLVVCDTVNCNVYFVWMLSKKGLIYNQHINNNNNSTSSRSSRRSSNRSATSTTDNKNNTNNKSTHS